MPTRQAAFAQSLISLAGWLSVLAGAGLFLYWSLGWIRFWGSTSIYESTMVNTARLWMSGVSVYGYEVFQGPPFQMPYYPPLFYAGEILLFKLGLDGYAAGRLISGASAVGCALLTLSHARLRGYGWAAGARAGVLVLLAAPIFGEAAIVSRVDMFGAFLQMAAVLWYIRYKEHPKLWIGVTVLLAMCVYAKQTMLAAPAAIFIHALLHKPVRAFVIAGLTTAIGLTALFLFQRSTQGGFLYHLVTLNAYPPMPELIPGRVRVLLQDPVSLVVLGLCGAHLLTGSWKSVETWFFLIAVSLGIVTVGYPGAGQAYFAPAMASAGLCLTRWFREPAEGEGQRAFHLMTALVVLVTVMQHSPGARKIWQGELNGVNWVRENQTAIQGLRERFSQKDTVLHIDIQLPVLMGEFPVIPATAGYNYFLKHGFIKKDWLLAQMKTGHIAGVVLRKDMNPYMWLSPEQETYMRREFRVDPAFKTPFERYELWIPRKRRNSS